MPPEFMKGLVEALGIAILVLAIISWFIGLIFAWGLKCFKFFPNYGVLDLTMFTTPLALFIILFIFHYCCS